MKPFDLRSFASSHRLILGSSSPWRQKVIADRGCHLTSINPDIDEKAIRHPDPQVLSMRIAHAKADACLRKNSSESPAIIICSDQVAVYRGEIREKPLDEQEARRFLSSYSGSGEPAQTVTSIVVVNTASGTRVETVDVARVWFKEIPKQVMDQIVQAKVVFTCSGGFCIDDGVMEQYIERVEGTRESILAAPFSIIEKMVEEVIDKDGGWESPAVQQLLKPIAK